MPAECNRVSDATLSRQKSAEAILAGESSRAKPSLKVRRTHDREGPNIRRCLSAAIWAISEWQPSFPQRERACGEG